MTAGRVLLTTITAAAVAVIVVAAPANAAVSISAPTSAALGTRATGSATLSAQLGTITVTASGLVAPSFVSTVSASNFTTGGQTANETLAKSVISYWSGPATSTSGLATATPGQLTAAQAVSLSTARTAFSGTGLLLSISASWNPTIVVNLPPTAVAGTYSGTITHSVA
jgi:hypothetical protein